MRWLVKFKMAAEVFNRENGSYDSDFLDDTALIKAFDNAIKPIKAMMGETHGTTDSQATLGSNKPKKKSQKRNKGNAKRKGEFIELRSNVAVNGVAKQQQQSDRWHVGRRCQAVYSEDGQIYNAVIVAMDDDAGTCTVQYDYYNNEEVQQLDDLLPPSFERDSNSSLRVDPGSAASVNSGSRTGQQRHIPHHHHHHCHHRYSGPTTRKERRQFRPFMPPPPLSFPPPSGVGVGFPPAGMMPPFVPPGMAHHLPHPGSFPVFPPPPPAMPGGDSDGDKEPLYGMLISWYMCGYYTGFYHGCSSHHEHSTPDSCTVEAPTTSDADESFTQDKH